MTILVIGATGATGKLLVAQLLESGHQVKAIVRSPNGLPEEIRDHPSLTLTKASVHDIDESVLVKIVRDCDAAASCIGHNLSWGGVFGPPYRLVTDSVRRICEASRSNSHSSPFKFVLMNTTGVRNRDRSEPVSAAQLGVISLLRLLLPPHADNEKAADYLRTKIGQNDQTLEWVVVRPDGLIDETKVSNYDLHSSPKRSAIFDAGKTSRINVAHFMSALICNKLLWKEWVGQMPVIYNQDEKNF